MAGGPIDPFGEAFPFSVVFNYAAMKSSNPEAILCRKNYKMLPHFVSLLTKINVFTGIILMNSIDRQFCPVFNSARHVIYVGPDVNPGDRFFVFFCNTVNC